MTQGERLFNVILIIFCFLAGLSNLFDIRNRPIEKIGVLLFQHLIITEHSGTPFGTPQTPMNTRFSYMFLYVPLYYIKEYIESIE